MIRIAELLDLDTPRDLWRQLRQIGVEEVVSLLDSGEQRMRWLRQASQSADRHAATATAGSGERSWSRPALERLKERYGEAGFTLAVIEDTPPMDAIRL